MPLAPVAWYWPWRWVTSGGGPGGSGTVRPAAVASSSTCLESAMSFAWRRSIAWRCASSGPAAVKSGCRTGLTLRGAAAGTAAAVAAAAPVWLLGDRGAPPVKLAARALTECWFLWGSNVGASSNGRMVRGSGSAVGIGSGESSSEGEGETSTPPLTLTPPNRGTSAGRWSAAGGSGGGELVELAGGRRELWRLPGLLR